MATAVREISLNEVVDGILLQHPVAPEVDERSAFEEITGLVHAAGVSPSQAPVDAILAVDLYGTAVLLKEIVDVISRGGAGVVIASQSGHRLPALTPEQGPSAGDHPRRGTAGASHAPARPGHPHAARLPARQRHCA